MTPMLRNPMREICGAIAFAKADALATVMGACPGSEQWLVFSPDGGAPPSERECTDLLKMLIQNALRERHGFVTMPRGMARSLLVFLTEDA